MQGKDVVQLVVGRQAVLIGLVGAEFGGRWFREGGFRYGRDITGLSRALVDTVAKGENLGFEEIADGGEPATHIAVEGAIAHGQFAFVASREE